MATLAVRLGAGNVVQGIADPGVLRGGGVGVIRGHPVGLEPDVLEQRTVVNGAVDVRLAQRFRSMVLA